MSIDGFLAQKYAILAQQADTAWIEAVAKGDYYKQAGAAQATDAAARLADVTGQNKLRGIQGDAMTTNTSLAPMESIARVGGVNAAADQTRAQTAETLANTRLMDQLGGGAGVYGQYLGYAPRSVMNSNAPRIGGGAPVIGNPGTTMYSGSSVIDPNQPVVPVGSKPLPPGWSQPDLDPTKKYSKGTSKVPGKGDGKTDTVAAKLAPGEAVLNKAAAEHLGRPVIDLLNAVGQAKMGLGMTPTQKAETGADAAPGFAAGTSSIGGVIAGTAPGTRSTELAAMPGVANGLQVWAPTPHGLVPVAMPAAQPQLVTMAAPGGLVGYAAGTSNVGKAGKGKSAAKAPAKSKSAPKGKSPTITPQLVQALMAMGGQAGMM